MAKITILEKEFHPPDPNAKNDGKQLHVPLGNDGKGMKFLNRETGDLELHGAWTEIFKTPIVNHKLQYYCKTCNMNIPAMHVKTDELNNYCHIKVIYTKPENLKEIECGPIIKHG